MHDVHFILTYGISVYSFWNGSKSHLPNLYKIQESHLIIPCTSAGIERAFSKAQIPLGSTRLDSTRHIRRVEPMHFGCVELVEQHSSTRSTGSTRRARQALLDHRNSFIV